MIYIFLFLLLLFYTYAIINENLILQYEADDSNY